MKIITLTLSFKTKFVQNEGTDSEANKDIEKGCECYKELSEKKK